MPRHDTKYNDKYSTMTLHYLFIYDLTKSVNIFITHYKLFKPVIGDQFYLFLLYLRITSTITSILTSMI